MQEQCALNKHLTFITSMKSVVCSFVRQFDCVTVIKSTSTQKVLQPKGNDMQSSEPCISLTICRVQSVFITLPNI